MKIRNSRELRCAYESLAIWNELLADAKAELNRQNNKYFALIRNSKELWHGTEWMDVLVAEAEAANKKINHAETRIHALKLDIRKYNNRPEPEEILVKDYGIDGYVIRKPLPDCLTTVKDAEEWFKENEYMTCRPSMYDCTGDLFTSWYKIYEKDGRLWCYHSIGVDV